jgi:hypothetical protein
MISRRRLFQLTGAAALAYPLARLSRAGSGAVAKRLIVVYFPDGVIGPSQSGDPSLWDAASSPLLAPLAPYLGQLVSFRGLSMGPTDAGSHPGGAKKLLTATDGGNGVSLDQYLAGTVGANDPFHTLYLGAQVNGDNPSGDMYISYVSPGATTPPEDDPNVAFQRVFGNVGTPSDPDKARKVSVLDNAQAEIKALEMQLAGSEAQKLDLHLQAVREVEMRIQGIAGGACSPPSLSIDSSNVYAPEQFPAILKAQMDLMVSAMACGMTRVGVIQASHHTSNLIMSRFAGTPMYTPNFDMRSHQASHYGASHDDSNTQYHAYVQQVTWWVSQYAYLLGQLAARPEGSGTMLDNSLVLLCTEICDGNVHGHDDMPFLLAGGGAGSIKTGQQLSFPYRRHADLLLALGIAMGAQMTFFGDSSSGPLPGLLS